MKFILFLLSAILGAPAAQAEVISNRVVSLQVKNIGIRKALESLLGYDESVKFQISENVTNDKRISVRIKQGRLTDIFDLIVREGGLSYVVSPDGTVEIDRDEDAKPLMEGITTEEMKP
ncbi:MAG: hypothetical protein ABL958_20145 [Bdellovibrionia bacterium]